MNPKHTPKQNMVRRYIVGNLFPVCGKDPMPLNELAISRKFGINRLTVRKVCADLISEHSLITLPGKRGLFINPDYLRLRGAGRFIGIIGSALQMPLIENINFRIISSFDRTMEESDGDYHFLTFSTKKPNEIADEILSSPMTGLLWLLPAPEMLPVFEKVVENGLPAVAVAAAYEEDWKPPKFNAVLYDHISIGRDRARTVLQTGAKRPGYFGKTDGKIYSGFRLELGKSGWSCGKDSSWPLDERFYPDIRSRIRSGEIDSLVMDGLIMISFLDFYRAVPELKQIPLFIDYAPRTRIIHSIDPELQVVFFRNFLPRVEYAGVTAAAMMTQLISSGGGQLKNRIIDVPDAATVPEYDKEQTKVSENKRKERITK